MPHNSLTPTEQARCSISFMRSHSLDTDRVELQHLVGQLPTGLVLYVRWSRPRVWAHVCRGRLLTSCCSLAVRTTALHAEQSLCLELLDVTFYVAGSGDPHELINIPRHAMPYLNMFTPPGMFQKHFLGPTRRANKFKYAVAYVWLHISAHEGGWQY